MILFPKDSMNFKSLLQVGFSLFLFSIFSACSNSNSAPNILIAPLVISVNNTTGLAVVADAQNNNLSIITTADNDIVGDQPIISQTSSTIIPTLPQDISTFALANGNTRTFLVGTGGFSDNNTITVLDYDPSVTRISYASINDIVVGANPNDELLGLAINTTLNVVYVSDYSSSLVYAFDANTGLAMPGSPITVQANPGKMHWNPDSNLLVVSSLSTNSVTLINTQDLSLPVQTLNVGEFTSSVASATNGNGTALFTIFPQSNSIGIYDLDLSNPASSTQLLPTIVPPPLGASLTSGDVLSGAATLITASTLESGILAASFTQSTGDMGWINVLADLSGYSAGRVVTLSGQNAYGISIQNDSNGNPLNAYFASPGGSTVSIVNILTNTFTGQIL